LATNITIGIDIPASQLQWEHDIEKIINNLKTKNIPQITVSIDEKATTTVFQSQLNQILKNLNLKGTSGKKGSIGIFDTTDLKAQGIKYYDTTVDIIEKIKNEYKTSNGHTNSVNVTNIHKNELKEIENLSVAVTKYTGEIEKLNFVRAKINNQGAISDGFVFQSSTGADKLIGSDLEKKFATLQKYSDQVLRIKQRFTSSSNAITDPKHLTLLNKEYSKIFNEINSIRSSSDAMSKGQSTNLNKMIEKVTRLGGAYRTLEQTKVKTEKSTSQSLDFTKLKNNSIEKLEKFWANNTKALKLYKNEYDSVSNAYRNATIPDDVTKADIAFQNLRKSIRDTGSTGMSTVQKISGLFERFTQWYSISRLIIMATNTFKQMYDTVVELDASFVELQKVTDLSGNSLKTFTNNAFDMGEAIGRTAKDVIDATTIFKRAGYELQNSFELAKSALIMTNVGDGINDVKDASSALIAVLKGFNMKDTQAMGVLDAINEVSNTSAIDFASITEGLRRVSGTLSQTGASLEETIGLLTGGFGSLRDIETVSAGLIMISQRLRGIGEDGEVIDGLAPKLQKAFKNIAKIDIQDKSGNLRNTFDILTDMSKIMPTLSDENQQYLGELAGGNRQVKVLNAILNGWQDVEKAVNSATNSQGSALKENEKFLNSIQGKLNLLTSEFQKMATKTVDSGLVKFIIDFGTSILKLINSSGSLIPVLTLVGTLIAGFKLKGLSDLFQPFISKLQQTSMYLNTFGDSAKSASISAGLLTSALSFGAVLVVQALIGVIGHLIEEQKRSIEIANELANTYKSTVKEINSVISTLKNLDEEFKTLSKGVDQYGNNVSLSADEYLRYKEILQEILTISPELIEGYDIEGKAFADKNKLIQASIDLQKEKLRQDREEITSTEKLWKLTKGYNAEYTKINRELFDKNGKDFYNILQNLIPKRLSQETKFFADLAEQISGKDINTSSGTYWSFGTILLDNLTTTYQEMAKRTDLFTEEDLNKFKDYIDEKNSLSADLEKQTKKLNPILQELPQSLTAYDKLTDAQKSFITTYINGFKITPDEIKNSDAISTLRDEILDFTQDLANSSTAQEAINNFFSLDTSKLTANEWEKKVNEIVKIISSELDMDISDIKLRLGITFETNDKQIYSMKTNMKKEISNVLKQISFEELGKLTVDQLTMAFEHLNDVGDVTFSQLVKKLKEFTDTVPESGDSLESLKGQLKSLKGAYNTLKDAIDEYHKNGYISIDTLEGLMDLGDDYLQYLIDENGNLDLNKDAIKKVIIAKLENIKASKMTAINTEIESLEKERQAYIDSGDEAETATQKIIELALAQTILRNNINGTVEDWKNHPAIKALLAEIALIDNSIANIDSALDPTGIGKETEDAIEKEFKVLEEKYKQQEITTQQYYESLNTINEKYYANNKDHIDDYESNLTQLRELEAKLSTERIGDMEHEIFKLQQKAGTEKEQVAIYKNIQAEILSEIERYKKLGLDLNNDTIQELEKQWDEYANYIVDTNAKSFENLRSELDHKADILSRTKGNEQEIVEIYKKAQESISQQYSESKNDQSEANKQHLRELENQWYAYADKIAEVNSNSLDKVQEMFTAFQQSAVKQLEKEVDSLNDQLDKTNNNFDKQIEALRDQKKTMDEQLEDQKQLLEVEEKRKALEDAKKQKTALIYRENRGFDYEVDAGEVEKAQKDYDDAIADRNKTLKDNALEAQIEVLEDAKKANEESVKAQIKNLEDLKKGWEDVLDIDSEMEMYTSTLFKLSGFENMSYDERTTMLKTFSNAFNELGVVKQQLDLNKQTENFQNAVNQQADVSDTQQENLKNLHDTFGKAFDISTELNSYSSMIQALESGENNSYTTRLKSFASFVQEMAKLQSFLLGVMGGEKGGTNFSLPSILGNFSKSGSFDIPDALKSVWDIAESVRVSGQSSSSSTSAKSNTSGSLVDILSSLFGGSPSSDTSSSAQKPMSMADALAKEFAGNPVGTQSYKEEIHAKDNRSKAEADEINARKSAGIYIPVGEMTPAQREEYEYAINKRLSSMYQAETGSGYGIHGVPVWARDTGYNYYANGTMSSKGGASVVGENGRELRILNRGDGILTNKITENIAKLGQAVPNILQNLTGGSSFAKVPNISIGDIYMSGVQDENGLAKKIKERFPNALMQEIYKK
jgi:TP901 family phage tail tape measure protein